MAFTPELFNKANLSSITKLHAVLLVNFVLEIKINTKMKTIDKNYVNGQFTASKGTEIIEIFNPANNLPIGKVVMGTVSDIQAAIESAANAFPAFSRSSKEERMEYLQRLHDAIMERLEDLQEVTIDEYGATVQRSLWSNRYVLPVPGCWCRNSCYPR
jgi:aldehyde dehydrogenase (NAD+)